MTTEQTKTEDYSEPSVGSKSECSKGWFGIPTYNGEEDICKKCGASEREGCKAKRHNNR